jgi:subtilisin family serine protease
MRNTGAVLVALVAGAMSVLALSAAARPQPPSRVHPALTEPHYRSIIPGRSPFALEGPDGRILARVRTVEPERLRRDAPRLGVVVRALIGGIASVEVPETALPGLASLPGVMSIQPAPVYHPANDISTAEVGADAVAAAYGGTGRGVIVAVVDSGLDFRHLDFRNADGTSRVLAAWDQTDAAGGGAGCAPGITFGRCWSGADLDADLAGGPAAGLFDGYGHGTHVAGIAAGNGRATANGVPAGTYAGVAAEADLLIVKVFNSQGVWSGGDLPAALAWIRDRAAEAGEPFVINMSFASDFGPHDGTRADELAVDALLAPGEPGRAAAIAAGNRRNARIHATGVASAGIANQHAFQIPAYTPDTGANNDTLYFDLWYEGDDDLTVSLIDANNVTLATAVRGALVAACTTSGRVSIDARNTGDPDNLDNEVSIVISDSSACVPVTPPPSNRTLTIQVTGVAVPEGGAYHLWTESDLGSGARARFVQGVESTTVSMPATANRALSVGAYWTRYCWPNADPGTGTTCVTCPPPNGGSACPPLGTLADESGAGPTRDGRLKPDLVAPYAVVSSLSSAAPQPPPQFVSHDGLHFPGAGTSQAAPHVAGALAVLLQFNPHLDAGQSRQMLIDGARADAFTGVVPNPLYGEGKLGILSGTQALLKIIDDLSADIDGSFTWSPATLSTSYNVYRADLPIIAPPSYGTCLESGLLLPGFSDAQMPPSAAGYLYLVTGAKDGIEGSLGFDSLGQQRPNVAPCP